MSEEEKEAIQSMARLLQRLGLWVISRAGDHESCFIQEGLNDFQDRMETLFPYVETKKVEG